MASSGAVRDSRIAGIRRISKVRIRGNNRLLFITWSCLYDTVMEVNVMETKNVILELHTKRGLSQDELAEKIMVTRQAVSRWENGV